jgi:hypothetical protein
MNKRGTAWVFIILVGVFVGLVLALGIYGGKQAQKENSQCSLGFGKSFCWVWETQVYEESIIIEEGYGEGSGGSTGIG